MPQKLPDMRIYVLASLLAVLASVLSPVPAQGSAGPSVRDVVEFKSIVQPLGNDAEALRRQTSPDGTRAFIVTRKADVASDTNRYEVLMLDLDAQRLSEGRPNPPQVVFTLNAKFDEYGGYPALAEVQWAGEQRLVFRAKIHDDIFQVHSVDLQTRQVSRLTYSPMSIWSFAISSDLTRLVYVALVPNPPLKDGARSIVVGNQWARGVLYGQEPLKNQITRFQFYAEDVGSGASRRPLGEPFLLTNAGLPVANISPDGRWAILPQYERERSPAWRQQYPLIDQVTKAHGPAMQMDPLGYFTGSTAYAARRMVAWRLDDAAAFVAAGGSEGIDGAIKLLERWVASRLGLREGQCLVKLGGSQGARARALVAGLAVQADLCSAAFVARHFGRAKATLCEQMAASRRRAEDRRLLATPMLEVLSESVRLRGRNGPDCWR